MKSITLLAINILTPLDNCRLFTGIFNVILLIKQCLRLKIIQKKLLKLKKDKTVKNFYYNYFLKNKSI